MKSYVSILLIILLIFTVGCNDTQKSEDTTTIKTESSEITPKIESEIINLAKECDQNPPFKDCFVNGIIDSSELTDFKICEDIKDSDFTPRVSKKIAYEDCLVAFSMKDNSAEPCKSIIPMTETQADSCIKLLASWSENIYWCDELESTTERDLCYMGLITGFAMGKDYKIDTSICTEKITPSFKLDCMWGIIMGNVNGDCKEIQDEDEKSKCYKDIISKLDNCKSISDKDQKFECYNSIEY